MKTARVKQEMFRAVTDAAGSVHKRLTHVMSFPVTKAHHAGSCYPHFTDEETGLARLGSVQRSKSE